MSGVSARGFADLHAVARRASRRAEEADDLVQSALLAALEAGRSDLAAPANRRWLTGVIRKQAAFEARTAARRRRDDRWSTERPPASEEQAERMALESLPPALRVTALLALTGHTKQEIAWLLKLSDTALRQRISQLKRALGAEQAPGEPGLAGQLAFGRIRRSLLGLVRHESTVLASHDPDGHLFVVSRSQNAAPRQRQGK